MEEQKVEPDVLAAELAGATLLGVKRDYGPQPSPAPPSPAEPARVERCCRCGSTHGNLYVLDGGLPNHAGGKCVPALQQDIVDLRARLAESEAGNRSMHGECDALAAELAAIRAGEIESWTLGRRKEDT